MKYIVNRQRHNQQQRAPEQGKVLGFENRIENAIDCRQNCTDRHSQRTSWQNRCTIERIDYDHNSRGQNIGEREPDVFGQCNQNQEEQGKSHTDQQVLIGRSPWGRLSCNLRRWRNEQRERRF